MKRYFFFAALFPPMFMNTLLTAARPADLLHYFIAGYFVAMVPALMAAFADALLEDRRAALRAAACAACGLILTPALFLGFEAANAWQAVQLAVCAALAGFICAMAYIQLAGRFPLLQDKPVAGARA